MSRELFVMEWRVFRAKKCRATRRLNVEIAAGRPQSCGSFVEIGRRAVLAIDRQVAVVDLERHRATWPSCRGGLPAPSCGRRRGTNCRAHALAAIASSRGNRASCRSTLSTAPFVVVHHLRGVVIEIHVVRRGAMRGEQFHAALERGSSCFQPRYMRHNRPMAVVAGPLPGLT